VLHLPTQKSIDGVLKQLAAAGLPNLWIPDKDSFCQVDEIPLLGTGKFDLKAIKQLAEERVLGGAGATKS
jgi:acyl-[acyl-carrier-protein]-phospholipid O-acyltransferase/long-chain-fatty-acid--[acyl-carrier-protein] ligase